MAKKPPQEKLTPKQAKTLQQIKTNNRIEGSIDQSEGRDSRMSRDGGTGRRLRR